MFGTSTGAIVGIIIGIISGLVIIFLICREIICWYWKINKIVVLMEEQNKMIKQLFLHFGVSESLKNEILENKNDGSLKEKNKIELPPKEQKYSVIQDTVIRGGPKNDSYEIKQLHTGEIVYFQHMLYNSSDWFFVKSEDKKDKGWCLSCDLEKC